MKLRIGVIGLGEVWQQRHAPALHMLADRFEVRAVCDQVAHRAQHAAAEFNAAAVDGYHALTHREDLDAVLILSLQWFGALPILAACDSGKAVYCAAGMDLELAEAELVKQRVEEAGIAFMVEFPRRHAPATLRLKELIATRLGAPACCSVINDPWPTRPASTRNTTRPAGGGPPPRRAGRLVPLRGRSRRPPGLRRDARRQVGPGPG